MSDIKFHYFDAKGAGEATRLAFVIGGVKFEDIRHGADWPEFKPKTPLGQMPCLEVDGQMYCQGKAIARQAGKLSGTYPADFLQALRVDELIDIFVDMNSKIVPVIQGGLKGDEKTKAAVAIYEQIKHFAAKADEMFSQHQGPFFMGKDITIADLYWALALEAAVGLEGFNTEFYTLHPKLKELYDNVMNHSKVKEQYTK